MPVNMNSLCFVLFGIHTGMALTSSSHGVTRMNMVLGGTGVGSDKGGASSSGAGSSCDTTPGLLTVLSGLDAAVAGAVVSVFLILALLPGPIIRDNFNQYK